MTWRIRHQGSPRAVEGLSLAEVVEGLQDGLWEPTDEVMGPADRDWVALENHPQFADAALDLEPHPPRHYDDETHLDFNPRHRQEVVSPRLLRDQRQELPEILGSLPPPLQEQSAPAGGIDGRCVFGF